MDLGGPPAGRFLAVLGPADRLPEDFSPFWGWRTACREIFRRFGAGGPPAGYSFPVLEI